MNPKRIKQILFIVSFFLLTLSGLLLTYNLSMKENYNLLFDSDTARVIGDATELAKEHYRADVHPLFIFWVQPVVYLVSGIVLNKIIAVILVSAFCSSLSVLYLYKILERIEDNPKINLMLCAIYLFSFANIIFTSGIETYNFAALFLIMMWYYFVKKENENYTLYSCLFLVLFGVLNFSFTVTNIVIYLVVVMMLWLMKKIKIKHIIVIGIVTIGSVLVLNVAQKLIWHNTPVIWNTSISQETDTFSEKTFGKQNIKNVLINDYYNSWISNDVEMTFMYGIRYNGQNYIINFQDMSPINFLVISIFYIFLILLVGRNFKRKWQLNLGLLLSLGLNSVLHFIYGNNSTFLYSLHFLYLILLLFGVNLLLEKHKGFQNVSTLYLGLFLLFEFGKNTFIFAKVLNYIQEVVGSSYLVTNFGFLKTTILEIGIMFIIGIMIYIGTRMGKQMIKEKNGEKKLLKGVAIFLLLLFTECIFIGLETTENEKTFLWMHLKEKTNEFVPKEKLDYVSKDFKQEFQEEILKLEDYKKEMDLFQKENETVSVKDVNWTDYYYFGMANRKKIIYRPNTLIDIETKEVLKSFEEKCHYIIPNTYSVLIETVEGDFIQIKEDSLGVHYIVNGEDEILEGTKEEINLYNFDNQKYQNILKVLYGEILFNIKDGVIYPNIIVYDSPWYRDAAITSMVLKKTNNTDLIAEWTKRITELYDKQNGGIEEADNLGELLYILSTQENPNEELINRIEEEAERLARENPNGYYLYGQTDFGNQFLYQNLWYKLGLESVGREYHFDLESIPEDNYSKMAWWSDYEPTNKEPFEESKEYPYLSYAAKHKLGVGVIPWNENLYPLSWEIVASQANYESYRELDDYMAKAKVSPLHSWSASELLLLLLED